MKSQHWPLLLNNNKISVIDDIIAGSLYYKQPPPPASDFYNINRTNVEFKQPPGYYICLLGPTSETNIMFGCSSNTSIHIVTLKAQITCKTIDNHLERRIVLLSMIHTHECLQCKGSYSTRWTSKSNNDEWFCSPCEHNKNIRTHPMGWVLCGCCLP